MRRRITSVIDQQRALREVFRVRFGEEKPRNGKRPGRPILLPRVTSVSREGIEQIAAAYGGEVAPYTPDRQAPGWQVTVTEPRGIAIAVPPDFEPFTAAYEQWGNGINTVRCDGAAMQYRSRGRWVERACVCRERETANVEAVRVALDAGEEPPDPYERPCKLTTRLTFLILGIETFGLARVDTKSFYAHQEVPGMLELIREQRAAAWLRMEPRSRSVMAWDAKERQDKPETRNYPVIVVEPDFMPDALLQIDRPGSMAHLPAPTTRALGRGQRPQLGPGASIEPVGPQFTDTLPPPPTDIAPVDLDDAHALMGEVLDPEAEQRQNDVDAAWEASKPDQAVLPIDAPSGRAADPDGVGA